MEQPPTSQARAQSPTSQVRAQPQAQNSVINNATDVPQIFQYIMTTCTTIGKCLSLLGPLSRVFGLIDTVYSDLRKEHEKYKDLLKECSRLAIQHKQLIEEIKSHVAKVKKRAQMNTKIIERGKQKMQLKGNNIFNCLVDIEATIKESQTSSEELKKKYEDIIRNLSDFCSEAKAGQKRNECSADLTFMCAVAALVIGGGVVGGIFCAYPVIGALGIGCGCVADAMVGVLLWTVKGNFQECAENNEVLLETFSEIDGVLMENFKVLTEICGLLKELQDAVHCMSSHASARPSSDHSDTESTSSSEDDMNDFLIGLGFDSFKEASKELEMKCDYMLNNMSLKTPSLGLLSLDKKTQ